MAMKKVYDVEWSERQRQRDGTWKEGPSMRVGGIFKETLDDGSEAIKLRIYGPHGYWANLVKAEPKPQAAPPPPKQMPTEEDIPF